MSEGNPKHCHKINHNVIYNSNISVTSTIRLFLTVLVIIMSYMGEFINRQMPPNDCHCKTRKLSACCYLYQQTGNWRWQDQYRPDKQCPATGQKLDLMQWTWTRLRSASPENTWHTLICIIYCIKKLPHTP